MHKFPLWVVLLCLSGGLALWCSGRALYDLYGYWRLSAITPANNVQWHVKAHSSSHWGMEGDYQYAVSGKIYSGKTFFEKPVYLNPYAAQADLKKWEAHAWHVWYQPRHPELSSLSRYFPTKGMLHALLTLGILAYFCCARGMITASFRRNK